jgi:hypothetical protein
MALTTKAIQRASHVNLIAAPTPVMNRTGTTLAKGEVVALDIADTEAVNNPPLQLNNVVLVAAGNIDGILAVVDVGGADDEEVKVIIGGPCQALVDGGTLDVAKGDKLIATAASKNLTRSDATTDIVHARSLEANTGAAALKWIYLLPWPQAAGTDESP